MTDPLFQEFAWLLLGASAIGVLGSLLRQPVIVSFIAIGILASTFGDSSTEMRLQTGFLAELGVALLLFLVGLKLDVRLIRTLGPVALATGLGQVGFTAGLGFLICLALGMDAITSLYVSVALTFSSTIIIVKLLSDKRELETLHGRIALGFLIVQDLVVVVAMVVLSVFGVGVSEEDPFLELLQLAGALLGTVVGLVLFVRYCADRIMALVARTPELLVIFAIGWAAAAAALGEVAGFGKELGGLVAGISLGSTIYRETLSSRLASVRDFLLLFFFVTLGTHLEFEGLGHQVPAAIVLSIFVLIDNPLIVILIMVWMGYRGRTGFLAGLTVAQISEFSLIFMALGFGLGHVDAAPVGLVTLVGLVTIAVSVYMITYSHHLYQLMRRPLSLLDRHPWREAKDEGGKDDVDVVLFGLGRFGSRLYDHLEDAGYRILALDIDPHCVRQHRAAGRRAMFGDATDEELWTELPLGRARWVVLAAPFLSGGITASDGARGLISAARANRFQGRVALTARGEEEGKVLERSGADVVLHPFDEAAAAAVTRLVELDEAHDRELSGDAAEADATVS
ncbi:MAG: cation:proton antiporter [Kiloniellales bacterium]